MAPTSRTINYDALLTSTLDNYRETLVDNIFAFSVFLAAIKEAGGYELVDGGERIRENLMYGKTPVASYSGYDVLDTTPADGMTAAFYTWRQIATPIAISRIQERQNSGEAQILDLVRGKILQAEMSLAEEVNLQLLGKTFSGGAAISGNGGKDIDPLSLLIPKNPTASVTVGSIDQNVESWWRSRSIDASTNGGTSKDTGALKGWDVNTWVELQMAMRAAYNYASRGEGGNPNMVLTDQTGYETFEAGLADKTRYTQQSKGSLAFDNILFKVGCPIYWDEKVPDLENGVAFDSSSFATSTYFFLNTKFLKFKVDKETNFITTPFVRPEGQDAKVAQVLMYGNLTCSNRRKQALVYGVSQAIVS